MRHSCALLTLITLVRKRLVRSSALCVRAVCSQDVHTDSVYLVAIMIFEYVSF